MRIGLAHRVARYGKNLPITASDCKRRLFSGGAAEIAGDLSDLGVSHNDFGFADDTAEEMIDTMKRFHDGVLRRESFVRPRTTINSTEARMAAKNSASLDTFFNDLERASLDIPGSAGRPVVRPKEQLVRPFIWKDAEVQRLLKKREHVK